MTRVACVDIGTNTALLLVAEQGRDDILPVEEVATITRLGQGVDQTRSLHPDALARTLRCLEHYAARVGHHDASAVRVVATSAVRDARGSETLARAVREAFGAELEVLSGEEEARCSARGAFLGLPVEARPEVMFDLGGGSTEFVYCTHQDRDTPGVERAVSLDVGSVRMFERHLKTDPPPLTEQDALRNDVRAQLATLPPLRGRHGEPRVNALLGVAGTVTTLLAIEKELATYLPDKVHGASMSRAELEALTRRLLSLPVASRRALAGLEPARADVIVAGALITVAICQHFGAERLVVSDRGLRWGLAAELLSRRT